MDDDMRGEALIGDKAIVDAIRAAMRFVRNQGYYVPPTGYAYRGRPDLRPPGLEVELRGHRYAAPGATERAPTEIFRLHVWQLKSFGKRYHVKLIKHLPRQPTRSDGLYFPFSDE